MPGAPVRPADEPVSSYPMSSSNARSYAPSSYPTSGNYGESNSFSGAAGPRGGGGLSIPLEAVGTSNTSLLHSPGLLMMAGGDDPPSSGPSNAAAEKIWRSYLYGQLANVTKAAVWWSMFGTLMISIVGNDNAVGITRAAFNLALVVVSPLAGAVAERASIRRLLATSTVTRVLIWSVAVPAAWILLKNDPERAGWFLPCLVGLMFFDGVQVAFANVVDIDCGGLDTLSAQYNLPVDDTLRNKLNGCHQTVFDLSFILFTPPIALCVYLFSQHLEPLVPSSWVPYLGTDTGVFALVSSMGLVFFLLSAVSLGCYLVGIPRKVSSSLYSGSSGSDGSLSAGGQGGDERGSRSVLGGSGSGGMGSSMRGGPGFLTDTVGDNESETSETQTDLSSIHTLSLFQETVSRLEDVRDGFLIVLREKELGWRLVFLAFETALEDSMVSVVIPELALHCYSAASQTSSWGSLSSQFHQQDSNGVSSSTSYIPPTGGVSIATQSPSLTSAYSSSDIFYTAASGAMPASLSLPFLPSLDFSNLSSWLDVISNPFLDGVSNHALANLWAVAIIAVGKIGGCLAGLYMNRRWVPPASHSRNSAYRRLFWCVLASSLSVALLPLSQYIRLRQLAPAWLSAGLVFLSAFTFFLFSTAPKIGFATLLQGLVASQQVACKVFGFVGTFVTITDAVVIACVNLIITAFSPHFLSGLSCVTAVYLVHGLIEALLGPLLILEPPVSVGGGASDLTSGGSRGAARDARLMMAEAGFVMGGDIGGRGGITADGIMFGSAPNPSPNYGGLPGSYQGAAPPLQEQRPQQHMYWGNDSIGDVGAGGSVGTAYPVATDHRHQRVAGRMEGSH
ncbi:transmembrane protein [Cystoisospora suis]|uniref:Transmembrane protein n=1 Tax=Cystoisospora suis TaxID=483139 RepID=A0A2C6LFZ8_9APIC|nr:transmembrane protein [Cystoisospora suis]